jgi:hypothetical protein
MQWIKLLWVVNFFFFAVVLFFVWSKMTIIVKKVKTILPLISTIEALKEEERKLSGKQAA